MYVNVFDMWLERHFESVPSSLVCRLGTACMPLVLKNMLFAHACRRQEASRAPSPRRTRKERKGKGKRKSKRKGQVYPTSESDTPSFTFDLSRVNPRANALQRREMTQLLSAARIVRKGSSKPELARFIKRPTQSLRKWLRYHHGHLIACENIKFVKSWKTLAAQRRRMRSNSMVPQAQPLQQTDLQHLASDCHDQKSSWHLCASLFFGAHHTVGLFDDAGGQGHQFHEEEDFHRVAEVHGFDVKTQKGSRRKFRWRGAARVGERTHSGASKPNTSSIEALVISRMRHRYFKQKEVDEDWYQVSADSSMMYFICFGVLLFMVQVWLSSVTYSGMDRV